jgi:isoleucyl-tRNA synthetase
MISNSLGVEMKTDERLREVNTGFLDGNSEEDYHNYFVNLREKFEKRPEGGENLRDIARRVLNFLEDMEKKYENRKILIISHDYPLWMTETVMRGWGEEKAVWQKDDRKKMGQKSFIETGSSKKVEFMKLPRNLFGFADFHRPYVDEVSFSCSKCGGEMKRVPEVVDVWFDAGSMPFAQAHFPFEQKTSLLRRILKPGDKLDFPADYIAEGLDQTRGWFYTLLAISSLLGYERSYKNVISLGLVLDKYGRKMSKSKGNAVDPWEVTQNFGADALRWHFYTVGPPGEPKKFDENDIKKVLRNFIFLLYNSFSFLDLYSNDVQYEPNFKPKNILDKWIISRLNEVINLAGEGLDSYDIGGSAKELEVLVDDLSRWYIRRSRKRLQKTLESKEDKDDFREASFTLSYVLLQISKVSAPFIPFVSEALYQSLKEKIKGYDFKNSVHFEDWPEPGEVDSLLVDKMKIVREIASMVLSKREETGIKVKQPLGKLKINNEKLESEEELLSLLKEEVNVKNVIVDGKLEELELDTKITEELKQEGRFRELVRSIQKGRQDVGLNPKDRIYLGIDGDEAGKLATSKKEELKKGVRADDVYLGTLKNYDLSFETNIDGYKSKITIKKV